MASFPSPACAGNLRVFVCGLGLDGCDLKVLAGIRTESDWAGLRTATEFGGEVIVLPRVVQSESMEGQGLDNGLAVRHRSARRALILENEPDPLAVIGRLRRDGKGLTGPDPLGAHIPWRPDS